MLDLPYDKIDQIRKSITQFEDLVAVFAQAHGPGLLQVYNCEELPPPTSSFVDVIPLHELPDQDLSSYDGLLASFPILDLLRQDVMLLGPSFFPIERMFREANLDEVLHHTYRKLAAELVKHMAGSRVEGLTFSQAAVEAKAFQLAVLPALDSVDCSNLVGMIAFGDSVRLITQRVLRLIYNHPEEIYNLENFSRLSLASGRNWVAALQELSLFHPGLNTDSKHFVDMRVLLRMAGKEVSLQKTLLQLARDCYRRRNNSPKFLDTAYALMAEFWLTGSATEDLVAYCPHQDFEQFSEHGDALRVYRVLDDDDPAFIHQEGHNISLQKLLSDGLPPDYSQVIFTFPVIEILMGERCPPNRLQLGKVMANAGREQSLGRNLWLLARDLLENVCCQGSPSLRLLDAVLETATRACTLYSLMEPWGYWRRRWSFHLQKSYAVPRQTITQSMSGLDNILAAFYRALSDWYECFFAENLEAVLQQVLEHLRQLQRSVRYEIPAEVNVTGWLEQARQLQDICEDLVRLPSGGVIIERDEGDPADEQLQAASLPNYMRRVVSLSEPVPLISPFFSQAWASLLKARQKRQQLHGRERDVQRLIQQLAQLAAHLRTQDRLLYAPAHELSILHYAYELEIKHTETLLRELETSAKLHVSLKNPWGDLHVDMDLVLEVTNLGRVEAEDVQIILSQLKGIQLREETTLREMEVLNPGTSREVRYHIRPERLDAELRVDYLFRDRRGTRHNDAWTSHLYIRSMDEGPFVVKVNRYQFGRPIQNPSEFYGRVKELQDILSILKAGGRQNLLLRAPRRMGKTSLLYMLRNALLEPAIRRMFDIPTQWDADLNRVHPIFLSLHSFDIESGSVEIGYFFRTVVERIADALDLPGDSQRACLENYARRELEVGSVIAALEQTGEIFRKCPGERVVVLLDEYDEVYKPRSATLDRHLREFVSAEQHLTWIIASTLGLFKEVKSSSSPWFNVFEIVELKSLAPEAAKNLVEKPCQDEHVFWRSDAILALLAETGNHPAFTQLFCGKVIANLNHLKTNYVLRETIDTVADMIVEEQETAHSHFEFYWSDTPGIGQLILLLLDDHEGPLKRDELRRRVRARLQQLFGVLPAKKVVDLSGDMIEWQEREFKNGIDWVEKIINAISLDEQHRYVFTVPLFQRWLRRVRKFQDLDSETTEKISKDMESE